MKKNSKKCIYCERKLFARGMCQKHYARWKYRTYKDGKIPTSENLNFTKVRDRKETKNKCKCGNEKSIASTVCRECQRGRSNSYYRKAKEITLKQIEEAFECSFTYKETAKRLNITRKMLDSLRVKLDLNNKINTEHFRKEKNYSKNNKIPMELFTIDSRATSTTIRGYIIKFDLLPYECSICGLKNIWMKKPLTLHLDHINGNRNNNTLKNLRFLCPNCHTQTETYGNKNGSKNK